MATACTNDDAAMPRESSLISNTILHSHNFHKDRNRITINMQLTILATLLTSAVAFAPSNVAPTTSALSASLDGYTGALDPVGVFDPFGFAEKATDATLARYREAELAHGRVAMLATVGFLVGEKVEGSAFFFDAQISGPAITHITQVPDGFWAVIIAFIGAYEASRAEAGWVDPAECPVDQPGLLKSDYSCPMMLRSSHLCRPRSFRTDVLLCSPLLVSWHRKLLMDRESFSTFSPCLLKNRLDI